MRHPTKAAYTKREAAEFLGYSSAYVLRGLLQTIGVKLRRGERVPAHLLLELQGVEVAEVARVEERQRRRMALNAGVPGGAKRSVDRASGRDPWVRLPRGPRARVVRPPSLWERLEAIDYRKFLGGDIEVIAPAALGFCG